jgi:hypothetical protein
MDALLGLVTLGAVVYFLVWKDLIEPMLRPRSVKASEPRPAFVKRSRRSRVPNAANVGSPQQHAKSDPANVPPNVPGSAAIAADSHQVQSLPGGLVITRNELQQLAAAIAARATGATIDEAILKGWGLKKGGGPSYKRAKDLFDTATQAP